MSSDVRGLLLEHRAVVCVGTGGVGKTTISAALALLGAKLGRRTMVLTIDPARQLARALGLASLRHAGEPVETGDLAPPGLLQAAMLDQKGAWDAFITRHAPNAGVRDTLLQNSFYQKMSTSIPGSTEFMAIEELCRLDEGGEFDLVVVDTPPAGRAVDFLRAPDRIQRLLDPQVAQWLYRSGHGALQVVSTAVKWVMEWLQRTVDARAFREVSAFMHAMDAILGDVEERVTRARALLRSPRTAFVLVFGARERSIAGAIDLISMLGKSSVSVHTVVANRLHPVHVVGELSADAIDRALASSGAAVEVQQWLRATWEAARTTARRERQQLNRFAGEMPAGLGWIELPELDHDAHSLADLARLATLLEAPEATRPRRGNSSLSLMDRRLDVPPP